RSFYGLLQTLKLKKSSRLSHDVSFPDGDGKGSGRSRTAGFTAFGCGLACLWTLPQFAQCTAVLAWNDFDELRAGAVPVFQELAGLEAARGLEVLLNQGVQDGFVGLAFASGSTAVPLCHAAVHFLLGLAQHRL